MRLRCGVCHNNGKVLPINQDHVRAAPQWDSPECLRVLVEGLHDHAIFTADPQGIITSWQANATTILGWSATEIVGRSVNLLLVAEDPGLDGSEPRSQRESDEGLNEFPRWYQRRGGQRIRCSTRVVALRTETGDPEGFLYILRGCGDGELQPVLADRIAELESVTDHVPAFLAYVDWNQRYVRVNRAYEDFFGLSQDAIIGHTMQEVVGEPHYSIAEPYLRRVLLGEEVSFDSRLFDRSGVVRYITVHYTPNRNQQGALLGFVAMVRDITPQREAADALREANEQLAAIIQASPLAIVALTSEGLIKIWNPAAERLFGWTAAEVSGKSLPFIPEEARAEHRYMRERDLAGEGFSGREIRRRKKNGMLIDLRVSTAPVRDSTGRVTGIMSLYVDITQRKQDEARLRQSEHELRTLLEAIPDLITRFDRDLRIMYTNPAVERVTAIPAEQLVGRTHLELGLPAETAQLLHQGLQEVFHSGQVSSIEFSVPSPTGPRHYIGTAVPELGPDGQVVSVLAVTRNITERKLAEEALRASEERQRLAVNAANIGLWDWDIQQNEVIWSDRIYEFHGIAPGSFDGSVEHFRQLIHPEDRERVMTHLQQALDQRQPYEVEFRTIRPSGEVRWLSTVARVLYNAQQQPVRMLGAVLDTTERREAEEALRRSNRELEEFAYVASHDLQEPLRTINIYTQLLLRRFASQEVDVQEFAGYINNSVHRMERLIRDLLSYSRVINEEPHPATTTVEVLGSLHQALLVVAQRIQETGATVSVGDLPTVQADQTQLARVFQNLLSNALKYRQDQIAPRIYIAAEQQSGEWIISVRDNGIGFDPEYAQRIFGLFKRLHHEHQYPGTGLGLAICKRIVENYGGRMWAESQIGQGSTFFFTIPVRPTTGATSES